MNRVQEMLHRASIVDRCITASPNDSYDHGELPEAAKPLTHDVRVLVQALEDVQSIYQNLDALPEQIAFQMWNRVELVREGKE